VLGSLGARPKAQIRPLVHAARPLVEMPDCPGGLLKPSGCS